MFVWYFECQNVLQQAIRYIIGKKTFIEREHMEQCPKLALPCLNNCAVTMILCEAMEAHRSRCPLEKVKCKYFDIGCQTEVARQDMEMRNTTMMAKHLGLTKVKPPASWSV